MLGQIALPSAEPSKETWHAWVNIPMWNKQNEYRMNLRSLLLEMWLKWNGCNHNR